MIERYQREKEIDMQTYLDFTPTGRLSEAERDSDLLLIALAELDAAKGIYRAAGKSAQHGLTSIQVGIYKMAWKRVATIDLKQGVQNFKSIALQFYD